MKGLAITEKGIGDITSLEIKELINTKTEVKESYVIFNIKSLKDLCLLCYKCQSVSRILFLLDDFKIINNLLNTAKGKIEKIDFSDWLSKDINFVVRCIKTGYDDLSTAEIEEKIGEFIIDNIKKNKNYKQKVNLEEPDIIFLVYINDNHCYVGIDFSGFDLSKRTYRIFTHPASLKGTIAYALVRIADFSKKNNLIDPFTGSGTIPIEAALFASNFPVNFYNKEKFSFLKLKPFHNLDFDKFFKNADKKINKEKLNITGYDNSMKFVNYAKKNAKIAGIDKQINFSRVDVEWLDIKFKKNSVDKIVTDVPILSKYSDKNAVEKVYKELFYQSDYVLKKEGVVIVIVRDLNTIIKFYEEHNFGVVDQRKVYSGKQELFIVKLKRQKKNI